MVSPGLPWINCPSLHPITPAHLPVAHLGAPEKLGQGNGPLVTQPAPLGLRQQRTLPLRGGLGAAGLRQPQQRWGGRGEGTVASLPPPRPFLTPWGSLITSPSPPATPSWVQDPSPTRLLPTATSSLTIGLPLSLLLLVALMLLGASYWHRARLRQRLCQLKGPSCQYRYQAPPPLPRPPCLRHTTAVGSCSAPHRLPIASPSDRPPTPPFSAHAP